VSTISLLTVFGLMVPRLNDAHDMTMAAKRRSPAILANLMIDPPAPGFWVTLFLLPC
jgi:hypothetical protein